MITQTLLEIRARYSESTFISVAVKCDISRLLSALEAAEFMLCEVIRNSSDIIAKKKCSETRIEIEKILTVTEQKA